LLAFPYLHLPVIFFLEIENKFIADGEPMVIILDNEGIGKRMRGKGIRKSLEGYVE